MQSPKRKKTTLSLKKMRIAKITDTTAIRGGDIQTIAQDSEYCTGSVNDKNCNSQETIGTGTRLTYQLTQE
ncbi:hypothetical protein ACFQ1M_08240 [Sungkyunkwania multivorans]|uniref:Uncharacterized protein n=1 Tax=Sungkyunkwania multivorans TaxID=1173618 RepID=A0ABW3CXF2_9FLAO